MKAILRALFVVVTLSLACGLGVQDIHAQSTSGEKYFSQYGQFVRGAFLEKYESASNSRELYGLPISRAFISPSNGKLVQYFEKVRFEAAANSVVQISNLGELVRGKVQTAPVIDNSAACRTFIQTGFQVCHAFLDFFDANGGIQQFGYPISNVERRADGQQVQYFQKALLEHRAGLPAGKRIVVADLGRIAFYQLGEDRTMLAAERNPNEIISGTDKSNEIIELKVRAYPKNAVAPRSGSQTIYVIVQDQRLLPVFGATVELKITLPSGEPQNIRIPGATGANGITQYTFAYSTQSLGVAKVEVLVRLGEKLLGQTVTSFRIWW